MSPKQEYRFSSKSPDYGTPAVWVEAARSVMGSIDLDPATSVAFNRTVQAKHILTVNDNALASRHVWRGRLWVNPPYTKPYTLGGVRYPGLHRQFIDKLIEQHRNGHVTQAMLLINAETGMPWFKPLWRYALCFAYERIAFYQVFDGLEGEDTVTVTQKSPTHSNALVYFPPILDRFDYLNRFAETFEDLGRVVISEGLLSRSMP